MSPFYGDFNRGVDVLLVVLGIGAVFVPFGIWKVVEIIIWFFNHGG